ncbi:MAG: peptide chain release factor N(5)-glutamine methyltransferase [Caldimicrobium sp.]
MKVKEALNLIIKELSSIEDLYYAKKEALEILAHLLRVSPLNVYLHLEKDIPFNKVKEILKDRLKKKPLPYILKKAYFWNRPFYLEEGVLIPRQDTELLIEVFLKKGPKEGFILELGCGSGIISITLLLECPQLKAVALDISEKALKITQFNAKIYNVDSRLFLLKGNWLSPIKKFPFFKAILSNPPYISENEWEKLDPEVKLYEPKEALVGGEEGTEFQESILKEGSSYLTNDAFILFEMGYNQSTKIENLARTYGWEYVFFRDLQNFERVALLWKKERKNI